APAPATTRRLSLHDALPIYTLGRTSRSGGVHDGRQLIPCDGTNATLQLGNGEPPPPFHELLQAHGVLVTGFVDDDDVGRADAPRDRKSTRLNSSHVSISYAV